MKKNKHKASKHVNMFFNRINYTLINSYFYIFYLNLLNYILINNYFYIFYLNLLKWHSVSRYPRDDLDRLRLPNDIPQAVQSECCRPDLSCWCGTGPSSSNLRRRYASEIGQEGSSLFKKVSVYILIQSKNI